MVTLRGRPLEALARGARGRPHALGGIDLVIAITVSWVPLIPDYTRFSRDRAGLLGRGLGYFVADLAARARRAVRIVARALRSGRAAGAVVGAGLAAALALLAIPSTRPTRPSRTSTRPRSRSRTSCPASAARARPARLRRSRRSARSRSTCAATRLPPPARRVLRPAPGSPARALAADMRGTRGATSSTRRRFGPAARGLDAGFAAYQWLLPTGPTGGSTSSSSSEPPDLGVGASVPSFAVSLALGVVSRRRSASGLLEIRSPMGGITVIGNLARDTIDGGAPAGRGRAVPRRPGTAVAGQRFRIIARAPKPTGGRSCRPFRPRRPGHLASGAAHHLL